MSMPPDLIKRFFAAMQSGAAAEAEMMALFHEDAVYVEPFSGPARAHRGKNAIRAAMLEGWKNPLPEMRLTIDQIDLDGNELKVAWTCLSPALPGGKGQGVNLFTLRDGKIARLETRFLMLPEG
jgi:ketosteroid isomerase-like protein